MNAQRLTDLFGRLTPAFFIAAVSGLAQWRYSAFGFNPTDDGFVLACARRILGGQIPHLDFTAIHLAGSCYLHAPFVAFGGDHTYLISRYFVWVQLAFIAWAWTGISARVLDVELSPSIRICVGLTGFALSAHYFPVMAWHTIDGLFLLTAGFGISLANKGAGRFAGYVLMGAAILCKQNFLFCPPLIVLLFEQRQRGLAALAVLAAPMIYALIVVLSGGAGDAWLQLTTQGDMITPGFFKYLWEPAYAAGVVIGLLMAILLKAPSQHGEAPVLSLCGLAVVALLLGEASFAMTAGRYIGAPAFGLFGLACGATLGLATDRTRNTAHWRLGLVSVTAAWCTALSIGYNTPALATALSATLLLTLYFATPASPRAIRSSAAAIVAALTLLCLWSFDKARLKYVYLERPASELTWRLDGILPGGRGLLVDGNTYLVMRDLQAAIAEAGKPYAIQPDFAGWWVAADQANPLPVDWPQWIELGSPQLRDRAIAAMNAQRGKLAIIVAKYETALIARKLTPSPTSFRYPLAAYARTHFTKIGETQYFEIYR